MTANNPKTKSHLSWILKRLRRQIWFRAALISLGGILLAILAANSGLYMTHEFELEIGQAAVGTLLEIIASSMLAVTTFSLTAMVTVYGSATQLGTPRATQLFINDTTSQNVLSTFLGAFVFSIVGIIGLQTGAYGNQGRIALFIGTVILLAIVVVTLLRWIAHLTSFGRMSDVIDRVEDAATSSMKAFAANPHLGARPATSAPHQARPVLSVETGYVNHIDISVMDSIAEEKHVSIYVDAYPGTHVHPTRALVHLDGAVDREDEESIRGAFSIERHRAFDHDPRLGVIALSEIGSRALAPATNDPGTAIEIVNSMLRVLLLLPTDMKQDGGDENPAPVFVIRPQVEDFFDDAFAPMIREGAADIEVAIRLTKTLAALRDGIPFAASKAAQMAVHLDAAVAAAKPGKWSHSRFADVHHRLWRTEI